MIIPDNPLFVVELEDDEKVSLNVQTTNHLMSLHGLGYTKKQALKEIIWYHCEYLSNDRK